MLSMWIDCISFLFEHNLQVRQVWLTKIAHTWLLNNITNLPHITHTRNITCRLIKSVNNAAKSHINKDIIYSSTMYK